jgi:hypothetical protein
MLLIDGLRGNYKQYLAKLGDVLDASPTVMVGEAINQNSVKIGAY